MRDQTRKTKAVSGLVVVAFAALNAVVPVASAQVTSLETTQSVQNVTEAVPTGGGSSETIPNGTTSSIDTKLGDATGAVTDTTGAVTDTTDSLDKSTGGVVGGTAETVEDAEGTLNDTKKTVEDTTGQTGGAFRNTVDDGIGGNGIVDPNLTVNDPLETTDRSAGAKFATGDAGQASNNRARGGWTKEGSSPNGEGSTHRKNKEHAGNGNAGAAGSGAAGTSGPGRETFMTQLADAAVDAAEKLAFPLGLALMVCAFLMVQGRIDRKDDKLVLAPIDSEQDLLRFQ